MSKYSGMSRSQCPADCKPDRCIITERPNCAHPCMGGVQHALKSSAVLGRYAEACRAIGVRNIHEIMEGIAS
jgi:hypothetical protein